MNRRPAVTSSEAGMYSGFVAVAAVLLLVALLSHVAARPAGWQGPVVLASTAPETPFDNTLP